jgi:hypothetical protein
MSYYVYPSPVLLKIDVSPDLSIDYCDPFHEADGCWLNPLHLA